MTNSNQPYVILVEPQLAENVGMAARAMMNCGLYNMRLVNPREDHLSAKAISASSNAEEILETPKFSVRPQTPLPTCIMLRQRLPGTETRPSRFLPQTELQPS